MVGFCPQTDILDDNLTVESQLKLSCHLKNLKKSLVDDRVKETLEIVMLTDFAKKKVKELSGGMKRKLSVAMAIVFRPKIIILDEPTSGLDVQSRE